jgi:hypothetical protein
MHEGKITTAWRILRFAFFAAPFLAGLDKFTHLLVNWDQYLHPAVPRMTGIEAHTFMLGVGVIEMIAGLAVLTPLVRWAGYVISLWLFGIIINLVSMGAYYDIALRDLGLALGALGFAKLTEALQIGRVRVTTAEHRRAA